MKNIAAWAVVILGGGLLLNGFFNFITNEQLIKVAQIAFVAAAIFVGLEMLGYLPRALAAAA